MSAVAAKLWVIVPTFNEAPVLGGVLREWVAELRVRVSSFSLLVVDDGSTDETASVLEALRAEVPELQVIRQSNRGHGHACREGYRAALAGGADWIFQIDSDGQCDPAGFVAVWDARGDADAVLGRREKRQDGLARSIISRLLSVTVFGCTGVWLADANVPYRLMKASVLGRAIERVPNHLELANVALTLALATDPETRLRWQPITFRPRRLRQSSRSLRFYAGKGRRLIGELSQMRGLAESRAALAFLGLLALAAGLAAWLTPRLVGGLWWDTGFWGFVGPIAQRLGGATPLYSEGMRLPIAPLSFALAWLYRGNWLIDHALILMLKLVQVSVLFFGLRRRLGGWGSGVAALGTMALSLASKKYLLYDALTELWVAATLVLVFGRAIEDRGSPRRWEGVGAVAALALWTKQSTGLGILGVGAFWAWRAQSLRYWFRGCAVLGVGTALLISPLVNFPGLFEQVWKEGSLPKGGPVVLLRYPILYARDCLFVLIGPLPEWLGWHGVRFSWLANWPAALAFSGGAVSAAMGRNRGLWLSVFTMACLHSLSVPFFRWADENYSLCFVGIALIGQVRVPRAPALAFALALLIALGTVGKLGATLSAHADATVRRPEIQGFDSVLLRPRTDALFALLARVRELAGSQGSVLWLPSDPNVEAWLDRPRPHLHTVSIFPDLYWDRWVEEDLRALRAALPRVIVIGPLGYWQKFSRLWHPESPVWGAEHFVERLRKEVLPARYRTEEKMEVTFGFGSEQSNRAEFELFVLQ